MSLIYFEPDRLRQARQLAMLTKKEVAERSDVSPAAIGQYEAGIVAPRLDTVERLARALDVPIEFFSPGRPLQRLESSETHFESLRATTAKQRSRATAFAEQVWELSHALEAHVRFPDVDLPEDLAEIGRGEGPQAAARSLRAAWGLGSQPVGHLVAHLEARGIICCLAPPTEDGTPRIDAYSTLSFRRPLIVLTSDRADDVLRHRFSAAHELGHLVLHGAAPSGDLRLEREADAFAAEFLTPETTLLEELKPRLDFAHLYLLSERWGVAVKSLVFRSHELGLISESTARRAYIRLASAPQTLRPILQFQGEVPSLLNDAVDLAESRGVTVGSLAEQLRWKTKQVRQLLGLHEDTRPALRVVK
ncbi:XRE family transcriptional regulator [Aeromicrobium sp.]|uniref:helix-turn-helix domain-containing protein n=1 Tax=Aeromicrobium sp. TaxID=1871063 RepID=UPI0025C3A348|nr:XRE family transcriptional regulator [Aeromicrobium sp.]